MFQHYALLSYALTCALLIRRRSRSAWQTGDALGLRERGLWSGGGGGGAGAGAGGGGGDGGGGSIQPLLVFGACRGSDRGPLRPPPPLPRGRARALRGLCRGALAPHQARASLLRAPTWYLLRMRAGVQLRFQRTNQARK